MYKLSFKELNHFPTKTVKTDKEKGIVEVCFQPKLICMNTPSEDEYGDMPLKVYNWMMGDNTGVSDVMYTQDGKRYCYVLIIKAQAKCAKEDVFDAKIGERIALCRAKIKAFRFMARLYYKWAWQLQCILGERTTQYWGFMARSHSVVYQHIKYDSLLYREETHLKELLNELDTESPNKP